MEDGGNKRLPNDKSSIISVPDTFGVFTFVLSNITELKSIFNSGAIKINKY